MQYIPAFSSSIEFFLFARKVNSRNVSLDLHFDAPRTVVPLHRTLEESNTSETAWSFLVLTRCRNIIIMIYLYHAKRLFRGWGRPAGAEGQIMLKLVLWNKPLICINGSSSRLWLTDWLTDLVSRRHCQRLWRSQSCLPERVPKNLP